MRKARGLGAPWHRGLALILAMAAMSWGLYFAWGGARAEEYGPDGLVPQQLQAQPRARPRPSVHTLVVVPRSTRGCTLPYGHASYRGKAAAPHGWEIWIQTVHRCIDCPPEPGCKPGFFSHASIVQTSGKIAHSEFSTILSAGPGGDSTQCGGFDSYVVTWEAARRVRRTECGGLRTFELQYPITIRIKPKDLMVQGVVPEAADCRELVFCDAQSQYLAVTIRKNDALHLEVVVPFRVEE